VKYVHVVRWAVAAAMGLACLASAVPGAADALTFSAPAKIAGAPYASTHNLTALNCVSTTLCVAGDATGNLITTTHPTSGASAWTVAEQVDPSTSRNATSRTRAAPMTGHAPCRRRCSASSQNSLPPNALRHQPARGPGIGRPRLLNPAIG
jgi:hypothetical protein